MLYESRGRKIMKYRDLIQFEPVETVIQLISSEDADYAAQLVQTYVISERMAEVITEVIIPHLQFHYPHDNKGVLVVGNYGTGKSHLLSVLTSVARDSGLLQHLTNDLVKEEMGGITGQFQVLRLEIGAVTNDLRSIICSNLERFLAGIGVEYHFPAATRITNNKDCLYEMMDAFHSVYPEQGLLIAIDEMLDYLHSRKDFNLVLDLGFLRELGEVCKNTRIRVIAGVQESLFDNPKFQFVAESLRRVQDRFEQVKIAREDVAYVVEQRLLKKSETQRAMIKGHLEKFAGLFERMAANMHEFVNLYPVHPAYLEVFERVYIAEKREILKTISLHIRKLLDQDIPEDDPGLVSFDSYWSFIKENPTLRTDPDVKKVIDAANVVEEKLRTGVLNPVSRESSLRILSALSVHRLTTGEINVRMGLAPEEVKEGIALLIPGLPEQNADFLVITINTLLGEMRRLTSGKFIGYNKENHQYFIEVEGGEDPDVLICERAGDLSDYMLDQYYFALLRRVMQCSDETYVSGVSIWEYDLVWQEKKVTRTGYLFFGAPNERSTAQPPQDYCIYFLQPFDPLLFTDEERPDEVFFYLKERSPEFIEKLKLFGGAMEMMKIAPTPDRPIYREKGEEYLGELSSYLLENITNAFAVTYQGSKKPLAERLQGRSAGSFKEIIDQVASFCLGGYFAGEYPDYPSFPVLLTRQNLKPSIEEAIKYLATRQSRLGARVLDGLQLLDGEEIVPEKSPYANYFLGILQEKGGSQVVNREELIAGPDRAERDIFFKLEPEFVVVVLAALVYRGDIVLNLAGREINAGNLVDMTRINLDDLINFRYYKIPPTLNIPVLERLLVLLGLPPGLIKNESTREEAVRGIQEAALRTSRQVLFLQEEITGGLPCWGKNLISGEVQDGYRKLAGEHKSFLESLRRYNSVGRLKQFPYQEADIVHQLDIRERLQDVDKIALLARELGPYGAYLMTAEAVLSVDHPLAQDLQQLRAEFQGGLQDRKKLVASSFRQEMSRKARDLKKRYIEEYIHLHGKRRLNRREDERMARFLQDSRFEILKDLSEIKYLPGNQYRGLLNKVRSLIPCPDLTKDELEVQAICPHCHFRPAEEWEFPAVGLVLSQLDEELDNMLGGWCHIMLDFVADPGVTSSFELLETEQKRAVRKFQARGKLPGEIGEDFIQGMQLLFQGLDGVTFSVSGLKEVLAGDGGPCTVEEVKSRFAQYLADVLHGRNHEKVRMIIE
jgi:energy-coupling factor transporter ATP-binding protein EcfA2